MIKNKKKGVIDLALALLFIAFCMFFLFFGILVLGNKIDSDSGKNGGKLVTSILKVVNDPNYKISFPNNKLLNIDQNSITYKDKEIIIIMRKPETQSFKKSDFNGCISFFDNIFSLTLIQSIKLVNDKNTDITNSSAREKCNFLANESGMKISTIFSPDLFKKTTYKNSYDGDFDNIRVIVQQSSEKDYGIDISRNVNFKQYGDQYIGSFFLLDKKYEKENIQNTTYIKLVIHTIPSKLYDPEKNENKNLQILNENCDSFMSNIQKQNIMVFNEDDNISHLERAVICDIFNKKETLNLKIER